MTGTARPGGGEPTAAPGDPDGDRTAAPPAQNGELTARARIRYAALDLYATHGEDGVSMRRVAAEVGVTIGLIQHHFGTKEGLRRAVDDLVIDQIVTALAGVDHAGPADQIVAARDEAVRSLLRRDPQLVRYINRALLEPTGRGAPLLEALVDLTMREVDRLRRGGHASTHTSDKMQVVRTLMYQVGELFLEPVVDAIWDKIGGDPASRPALTISAEER